jgi:hypothetical protein
MTVETTFNGKLLWGVPDASRGGFLEKSPVKHLATGGKVFL